MWSMTRIEALAALVRPFWRFGLVGLGASAVHFAIATALIGLGVAVLAANCLAFLVALVVTLPGHHYFSFRSRAPFRRGVRRFVPGAVVGFVANNLVLASLVAATGESYAWIKIALAIFVIPPATFCYAYFFAYRD